MTAVWMHTVTQGWLVVELTDSALMLGLLAFFRSIPMLVISPFGGVLADRFDRARLILIAQFLLGGTALGIGVLVAIGWVEIWHLIVSSLIFGVTFAISVPARYAMLSELVPHRHVGNAVALNAATMNIARLVGPSVAGYLIGLIGIAGTYFVQVGANVWSIWNLARIRMEPRTNPPTGSNFTILKEGFVYVRNSKTLLRLMILTLSPALFGMPITMLLPAFVSQDLRGSAQDLGALMAALGVGALLGALGVIAWSRVRKRGRLMVVSLLFYGLLLLALGFVQTSFLAAVVLALSGVFQAVYMALNQTMLQLLIPSNIRGRVMSIWMLSWGLMPLGLLPMSFVAEHYGTPVAMRMGGALSIAVVLAVLAWNQDLWSLDPQGETEAE